MLSGNKLLEAYFHKHLPDCRFFSSCPAPTFHTLCQKCVRCLGTCWPSSESVTYTVSWPQLAHKTQANCHIMVSKGNHFSILMVSTAAWNGCSRDMASKRAFKCVSLRFLFIFFIFQGRHSRQKCLVPSVQNTRPYTYKCKHTHSLIHNIAKQPVICTISMFMKCSDKDLNLGIKYYKPRCSSVH